MQCLEEGVFKQYIQVKELACQVQHYRGWSMHNPKVNGVLGALACLLDMPAAASAVSHGTTSLDYIKRLCYMIGLHLQDSCENSLWCTRSHKTTQ